MNKFRILTISTMDRSNITFSMRFNALYTKPQKNQPIAYKYPKLYYKITRCWDAIMIEAFYTTKAGGVKKVNSMRNNIPIKKIERALVASRINFSLTMLDIHNIVINLRGYCNRIDTLN